MCMSTLTAGWWWILFDFLSRSAALGGLSRYARRQLCCHRRRRRRRRSVEPACHRTISMNFLTDRLDKRARIGFDNMLKRLSKPQLWQAHEKRGLNQFEFYFQFSFLFITNATNVTVQTRAQCKPSTNARHPECTGPNRRGKWYDTRATT